MALTKTDVLVLHRVYHNYKMYLSYNIIIKVSQNNEIIYVFANKIFFNRAYVNNLNIYYFRLFE